MLLREPRYRTCTSCEAQHLEENEVYGCDGCRKEIDMRKKHVEYLDATVHHRTEAAKSLHFCSWKCCMKGLPKVKTDYFISMPFLMFDSKAKGMRAKDFFAAIGKRR
jgi:hypothetical protein